MTDNKIPKHWQIKKLGEVCNFIGGGTPSKSNSSYWNGSIPWASIKDIKGQFLTKTVDFITEEGVRNSATNIANPNEIILATRINPGKPIISKLKTAINQDLKIAKPKEIINSLFLYYSFLNIEKEVVKKSNGTTVLGITLNNLNEIPIPIPPLPEQLAIVSKIEELLSDLENGKQQLLTAQQQLKVYRQSLLKAAFEGRLTNKKFKDEELPKGWKWEALATLTEVKDGTHDTPKYIEKGIPFITQKNIRESGLSFSDVKYISQEDHDKFFKRSNVTFNDILISMIGANRGMTCLVNDSRIFSIKNVGLIKSNSKIIIELYLLYFLKSSYAHSYVKSLSKGGAQEFVGLTELRKFPIVICSLSEQHQIVEILESKLTVCDKIEETIAQSLLQAETLKQSVLKKAFEGRLV